MAKLKVDRGTTFRISGTVRKDGVIVSLIGATIRFTMKAVEFDEIMDDSTADVIKNITDGTIDGAYTIVVLPIDTKDNIPGTYYYSTKVDVFSDGLEIYEIDEGTIKLDGDPTNRIS